MSKKQDELSKHFSVYSSEVLGRVVACGRRLSPSLPRYLVQRYDLHEVTVGGLRIGKSAGPRSGPSVRRRFLGVLAKEADALRPSVVEKHLRLLLGSLPEMEGGCLIAADLPAYLRKRLVERQISFVVPGRQLYWPVLGAAAQARTPRDVRIPPTVERLSPATQALLLGVLTGAVPASATPKTFAQRLGYTAMTMTRALDEIEGRALGSVVWRGRERWIDFAGVVASPSAWRRVLWETALPFLCSPVRDTVRIHENALSTKLRIDAGETALARWTDLAAPNEPVCALGRTAWQRLSSTAERIPIEDEGTCVVQLWRYEPGLFASDRCVDRFSLYLSLRDVADERVQAALINLLENTEWL